MLLKLLREGLGRLIVLIDWLTRPRKLRRPEEQQREVQVQLGELSLYQLYACPFCVKVRRAMHRLNLPIETRSTKQGSEFRQELQAEGGRLKVPCLRISEGDESRWLYESAEIIRYLEARFG